MNILAALALALSAQFAADVESGEKTYEGPTSPIVVFSHVGI